MQRQHNPIHISRNNKKWKYYWFSTFRAYWQKLQSSIDSASEGKEQRINHSGKKKRTQVLPTLSLVDRGWEERGSRGARANVLVFLRGHSVMLSMVSRI